MLITTTLWGQSKKNEISTLLEKNSTPDKNNLYTPSLLDYFIYKQINTISGTNIKEGKVYSTSATIDEKSITANYSIKTGKIFYLQPTVSGTAEKGALNIFSDKKYQKTLSGGSNFQWFPFANTIGFSEGTRIKLHNEMRFKEFSYNKIDKALRIKKLSDIINSYKEAYENNDSKAFINKIDEKKEGIYDDITTKNIEVLKSLNSYKNLLAKYNVIKTKENKEKTYREIYESLNKLDPEDIENYIDDQYTTEQDSLQLSIKPAYSIKWISGGIKYNVNPQQVLLDTITSGIKPEKFLNEYLTAKIVFNYLRVRNNNNKDKIYISPSINFSSERNFTSKNQRTVNFGTNTSVGGISTQNIDEKSYYISIPNRANVFYLDIPITYFFTKRNYGIDLGMKLGTNDPEDDNISARIGIYVPLGKDENIVFIEPMLKFQKLFSSGKNEFIKDNLLFGFNIAVSLPQYLKE
ncbi:hypothetical protein EGI16_11775 [Chryseobacterium sp. G0240]|nr:hypothetical protein EGI16_11775 [Chryseobacterium sp. G0240]